MSTYVDYVKVRTSDIDVFDRVKPDAYLDYFQDIAAEHAAYLNVGYEDSKKLGIAWVLTKTKLEILKTPEAYDTLAITTWPSNQTKYDFSRDYILKNKFNEVVARGTSQWILIDFNSRRIVPTKNLNFPQGIEEEPIFTKRLDKLSAYTGSLDDLKYSHKIVNSDLDHNGHTNNIKYAKIVFDALENKKNREISLFEINYNQEAYLGETINLYYEEKDNLVKGVGIIKETNKLSFSFEFTYKE